MFGLELLAPRFVVSSKRLNVLQEPSEFYSYLLSKIATAKERVFLASLYLGKTETELINVLADSLQRNDKLNVYVLVDALRGTREAPETTSASLLSPLALKYPDRVHLALYQTPKLGRITKSILPKRIVEGVGLQHMKIYGWDDEIVLSGANLSQDYFTNRQDRYISIRDHKLTNWFFDIHSAVSQLSYKLLPSTSPQGFEVIKPPKRDIALARTKLAQLIKPSVSSKSSRVTTEDREFSDRVQTDREFNSKDRDQIKDSETKLEQVREEQKEDRVKDRVENTPEKNKEVTKMDTATASDTNDANRFEDGDVTEIYPLCQFTPLGLGNELQAMRKITNVAAGPKNLYEWIFTAGYFNAESSLSETLAASRNKGQVIVAAPEANGFFESRGMSGTLPMFYSLLANRFLHRLPPGSPVHMREWSKGVVNQPKGWSYHAKGIWLFPGNGGKNDAAHALPTITYIGSSNFTRRSYAHDLECGAVLVAKGKNNPLHYQLHAEVSHLLKNCGPDLALKDLDSEFKGLTFIDRLLLALFGDRL